MYICTYMHILNIKSSGTNANKKYKSSTKISLSQKKLSCTTYVTKQIKWQHNTFSVTTYVCIYIYKNEIAFNQTKSRVFRIISIILVKYYLRAFINPLDIYNARSSCTNCNFTELMGDFSPIFTLTFSSLLSNLARAYIHSAKFL